LTKTAPRQAADTSVNRGRALAVTLGYAAIVVLAWGSNYPLMKRAIADMPPLTFTILRLWGAAAVIAVLIRARGDGPLCPPREERAALAGVGLLQFGSVLGLTSIALQYLPAGRTVTVVYSMPVWAALAAMLLGHGKPTRRHAIALALGLAGLLLFLNPAVVDWRARGVAAGMAMVLGAAVCWGIGAACYRGRQWRASMLCQTFWQLLAAAVLLTPCAWWFDTGQPVRPGAMLFTIIAWNWVVPTALALWAWTKLLSRVDPAVAGQLLALTPLVGIGCSALMFNESLPPAFALCALLIAAASCIVLWTPSSARRAGGGGAAQGGA